MNFNTIIGLAAGSLTTLALLPQVIKVIKEKKTRDISLGMYIMYLLGISLWFTYGILLNNIPIILTNIVSMILSVIIFYYKLRYK